MANRHDIIRLRRGTAAEWSASQPQPGGEILKLGEPGYEKDTGRLKIGDGTTPWNSLPYFNDGAPINPEELEDLIGGSGFMVAGTGINIYYNDIADTLTISASGIPLSSISGIDITGLDNDEFLVYNSGSGKLEPSHGLTYNDTPNRLVIDCDCPIGNAGLWLIGDQRSPLLRLNSYSENYTIEELGDQILRHTSRIIMFNARGTQASPSGCQVGDTMFNIRGDAYNPHGTLTPSGLLDNRTIRILGTVSASGTHYLGSDFIVNTSTGGPTVYDNSFRFTHDGKLYINNVNIASPSGLDISNNADNRVLTGTGSGINAESNLTFDGSTLDINGNILYGATSAGSATITSREDQAITISAGSAGASMNLDSSSSGNNGIDLITTGTGKVYVSNAWYLPNTDGAADAVLTTNGTGTASWTSVLVNDTEGAIILACKNNTLSTINIGTPVYISGHFANGKVYVEPADASNSAKMPAVGLLGSTLTSGSEGHVHIFGPLKLDTTGLGYTDPTDVGKTLYVASGGGLTLTRPTGETDLVQNIARLARIHNNGKYIILGPGRSNDVPNSIVSYKLDIDNIRIDGNTISSTDTNGNIILTPNGTGDVYINADTLRVGDSNTNATLTTNGTGDLILNTNSGTNSSSITIQDGSSGNILIQPNGNGNILAGNTSNAGSISSSVIGGGLNNDLQDGANYSVIAGGSENSLQEGSSTNNSPSYAVISGGYNNTINSASGGTGDYSVIGGGDSNYINAVTHSIICGGQQNSVDGDYAVVCGGLSQSVSSNNAFIGGGNNNSIGLSSDNSFIGGGVDNTITGQVSFIGGGGGSSGENNSISGNGNVVVGGIVNTIDGNYSCIVGGDTNSISTSSDNSFIGGGYLNNIDNSNYASIVGGYDNDIQSGGTYSFIGGGYGNYMLEYSTANNAPSYSFIGGGYDNGLVSNNSTGNIYYSSVVGGYQNVINSGGSTRSASYSVISGGDNNLIYESNNCIIGGGANNDIGDDANYSTIGGGANNDIGDAANYSTIGGGQYNTMRTGYYATIPGGLEAKTKDRAEFAYANGKFTDVGDAQYSMYVLKNTTSSSGWNSLYLDYNTNSDDTITIDSTTATFTINISGRAGNGDSAGFIIRGCIKNISGTVSLVGSPIIESFLDSNFATANVQIYTSSGGLTIQVDQGSSGVSGTVYWVATVQMSRVTY